MDTMLLKDNKTRYANLILSFDFVSSNLLSLMLLESEDSYPHKIILQSHKFDLFGWSTLECTLSLQNQPII